jgi:hypothetical protein
MSRVAVVFTGGTISTVFDHAGGNVPVPDGAAISPERPARLIADVVPPTGRLRRAT